MPDTTTIFGIDVSDYQPHIDWPTVYAAGIRFAFAKVTEGTHFRAETWKTNRPAMLELCDFVAGAYHFLRSDTGPVDQAHHFLDHADDLSSMAVALDVERSGSSRPTAQHARQWVEEFKQQTGGHSVIGYFPRWWWTETGRPDLGFFDAVWASHYVAGAGTPSGLYRRVPPSWWKPYGHNHVDVLQYTSTGRVPGISGSVDVNAHRGTLNQLRALATTPRETDMASVTSLASQTQTIPAHTTAAIRFTTEYSDKHNLHGDDDASIVVNDTYWAICNALFDITGLPPEGAVDVAWARVEPDGNDGWKPRDDAWHITYRADATGHIVDEIGGQLGLNKTVRLRLHVFNPTDTPVTLNHAIAKVTLLRY